MLTRLPMVPEYCIGSSVTTLALSSSTIGAGFTFAAKETATITRLGIGHSSQAGTVPTYRISLQSVNSSGFPSGTILGATANGYADTTASGWASNSFNWVTLGESVSVVKGNYYGIAVMYQSGTINASNRITINAGLNHLSGGYETRTERYASYSSSYTADTNRIPIFGYGSSTKAWGFAPSGIRATTNINSGASPKEVAAKINIPDPGNGATGWKLCGVNWVFSFSTAATMTLKLYSGGATTDTTAIIDTTIDNELFMSRSVTGPKELWFDDDSGTLAFGSDYRVSIQSDTADNLAENYLPITNADDVKTLGGVSGSYSSRAGGNWTDNTARFPMLHALLIEYVFGGAGGGGSFITPSIQGLTGVRSY